MKKQKRFPLPLLLALSLLALSLLAGCAAAPAAAPSPAASPAAEQAPIAAASDMAGVMDVEQPGRESVYAGQLNDGSYDIRVDSSSSMFRIDACELVVSGGEMYATMTMGGTGYLYVCMGTPEQAAAADSAAYISYTENADGTHSFTVPVQALDQGLDCAAFSKNKQLWYARTLVFRADSLPPEAYRDAVTPQTLALADGVYTVEVSLEGGSGRASVASPAKLTVENGLATAEIVWSSANYDYMKVGETQYFPINTQGNSTFAIPVSVFDRGMPVIADTVAMSQPYELEYALCFASDTVKPAA